MSQLPERETKISVDAAAPGENDPAKARFAVIQMIRLGGVFMVVFGMLLLSRKIRGFETAPQIIGYILAGLGLLEFFWLPIMLARRWRTAKGKDLK